MYKLMALLNLDSRDAIILAPRLFHGIHAGINDYTVYKMALNISGRVSSNVSWQFRLRF